jgi:hypothetical protein
MENPAVAGRASGNKVLADDPESKQSAALKQQRAKLLGLRPATPSSGMVVVFSDQICCGVLLNRGPRGGWEAFDHNDRRLGTYARQSEAADAVYAAAPR